MSIDYAREVEQDLLDGEQVTDAFGVLARLDEDREVPIDDDGYDWDGV